MATLKGNDSKKISVGNRVRVSELEQLCQRQQRAASAPEKGDGQFTAQSKIGQSWIVVWCNRSDDECGATYDLVNHTGHTNSQPQDTTEFFLFRVPSHLVEIELKTNSGVVDDANSQKKSKTKNKKRKGVGFTTAEDEVHSIPSRNNLAYDGIALKFVKILRPELRTSWCPGITVAGAAEKEEKGETLEFRTGTGEKGALSLLEEGLFDELCTNGPCQDTMLTVAESVARLENILNSMSAGVSSNSEPPPAAAAAGAGGPGPGAGADEGLGQSKEEEPKLPRFSRTEVAALALEIRQLLGVSGSPTHRVSGSHTTLYHISDHNKSPDVGIACKVAKFVTFAVVVVV